MKTQTLRAQTISRTIHAAAITLAVVMAWQGQATSQQPKPDTRTSNPAQTSAPVANASPSRSLPIIGSGKTNTIPIFTGTYTIGNSVISQSGSSVTVGGSVNAVSFAGDGTSVTNVNAATVGGLGSSAFAQTNAPNTFSADQTIKGNLIFSGSANSALILQGNLTDPTTGEQSANVIGGYPGNIVDPGVIGATIAGGGGYYNTTSRSAPKRPLLGKARGQSQPTRESEDANVVPGLVLQPNHVTGNGGYIGGGYGNFTLAGATIGGGSNNYSGFYGTVAGGQGNTAGGQYSSVAGGQSNKATGNWSSVGGGDGNTAASCYPSIPQCGPDSQTNSTVAGGVANTASGIESTVGGGGFNVAGGSFIGGTTVAGGQNNTASGDYSTIPGGLGNIANGDYSFAAGLDAQTNYNRSFVWSDGGDPNNLYNNPVQDTGPNQFVAEAIGGFFFYTTSTYGNPIGATLPAGSGSWSSLSDRNAKTNFSSIDGSLLLDKLAALPISTWNYRSQTDSVRHLGPTAQDFQAAFGLGEDDKHISTVDSEGVALASIQALYRTVTELKKDLDEKAQEVAELRARLAHLEQSAGSK